jgi:hypothetical protein
MVIDGNRKYDSVGKRNICGTVEAKTGRRNEKK